MGKAQSKRSVDITTESKKGADDEITEKMEKIEDLDKKESINGDATLQEKQDLEKKDSDEVENDKDMTNEKNADVQASGDSMEASNSVETPKDESGPATAEEIFPLSEENVKKSKKEKVKKKWSFRNISFGKKDKQKPAKSEETVEDEITATNGPETDEKPSKDAEDTQKEKSSSEVKENSTEHHENGDATQQELNGTEHNEEKLLEKKSNDLTANLTNNTTNEKSGRVQSETTAKSSDASEKTEITAVTAAFNIKTNISENNISVGVSRNDNGESKISNETEQEHESEKVGVTNASNETSAEKTSTLSDATSELSASANGEVLDKIHQNGDNIEQGVIELSKAQIEVNFNTDNKVSAATLDSFPFTSTDPSKDQVYNANMKNADENFEFNYKEESDVLKVTGTDEGNIHSSVRENINTVEDSDSNKETEKSSLLSTETIEINKSAKVENISGCESSPPPLPMSPPPSQVSVFAFINNEESAKDSFPAPNSETTVCPLNKENIQILPLHVDLVPESTNLNDIPENNKQFQSATNNDSTELDENNCNNGLTDQTCTCDEELQENKSTNSVLDNFEKKEEFFFAAEVIDEIANKAADIVSLQLETEFGKCNRDDINEETVLGVSNIVDHKEMVEDQNASECKTEKLTTFLLETSVALNQTNDTITESSFMLSANDANQPTQSEVLLLRVDEHLCPTKDFGNAKDLKDNATAAEITQDITVTCE